MRTLTLIALAAASLAAPAAYAQQDVQPSPQAQSATSSVRIQGTQPRYKLDASQFKDYSGRYLLSNGKGMSLSNEKKCFYAQVDGESRVEIVPVAYNVFVAKGTGTRLSFSQFHGVRTNDLVISEPALGSMRTASR